MKTPVADFVREYAESGTLRLHMPGHKGAGTIEQADITEIRGADPLYPARGILRESEENAAALFGAGRTVYSAEGSSLCIRAMLTLVRMRANAENIPPVILAGRNAHTAFICGAALADVQVEWLRGEDLLSCRPAREMVAARLDEMKPLPAAVYLTSPDYLGRRADIAGIAAVCHARGVPLLADNAHGAYLRYLEEDLHPLSLGADMTCDSAHKTLPALTGAAVLHIHKNAPEIFRAQAERAMALHASTSPSWLILRSLDECNAYLADGGAEEIRKTAARVEELKKRLTEAGYTLAGDEPLKVTIAPKARGYTGDELHDLLRGKGMECEFSDPDFLVAMITPATGTDGLKRLEEALLDIPAREAITERPPEAPEGERVLSLREAMLSEAERIPVNESIGRIVADPCVSCPPAVPVVMAGERIGEDTVRCMRYYGQEYIGCVKE